MVAPLVMSPIREKRRRQIMGIFAGKCDRNADMWLTYCAQNKKDIFWVQIVKYENLQRDKRIWRNINRQHYV
jgi:hypothetical protein